MVTKLSEHQFIDATCKTSSLKGKRAVFCCMAPIVVTVMIVLSSLQRLPPFTNDMYREPTQDIPCKLHRLDPWDPSMVTHEEKQTGMVDCGDSSSLVFVDAAGYLQFNNSAMELNLLTSLKCVYQIVRRIEGDREVTLEQPTQFKVPMFVQSRFFRVTCWNASSEPVYDFLHTNMNWNNPNMKEKNIGLENEDSYSIFILGYDSMSRSHAIRQLPKSYNYMMQNLKMYDFKGFMKRGPNTFPNVFSLLTGWNELPPNVSFSNLDRAPFLWKRDFLPNYATFYAEDGAEWSTFVWNGKKLMKTPTDYYYRPFTLAMEKLSKRNTYYCFGNTSHFHLQMDFFKQFISKYTGKLRFALLWTNIGHDEYNGIGRSDDYTLKFLTWLKTTGQLDRAILFVLSDHGYHRGYPSDTPTGRLERSMPFCAMHIPSVLIDRYPSLHETLALNTGRLSTPSDVYQTMVDVVHNKFVAATNPMITGTFIKRSLFSKIPERRTCEDAGVPNEYCVCIGKFSVNTNFALVPALANVAVDHINNLLSANATKGLCRHLKLKNVTSVEVSYSTRKEDGVHENNRIPTSKDLLLKMEHRKNYTGVYTVVMYALPGEGLFEVQVQYVQTTLNSTAGTMTPVGYPIRSNRYGNQSHCIITEPLTQYCYCNDL